MPEKKLFVAPVVSGVCRPSVHARRRGVARAAERLSGARALPVDIAWPPRAVEKGQAVVPVFLPFRGCPVRCVFCAQDVQTGLGAADGMFLVPGRVSRR